MARKSRQRRQQIPQTQQSKRTQQFFYEETVSSRSYSPTTPQIKKSFHVKDLKRITPITPAQEDLFFSWYDAERDGYVNDVVMALGAAGSGKSLSLFADVLSGGDAVLSGDPALNIDKIKKTEACTSVFLLRLPFTKGEKHCFAREGFIKLIPLTPL